MLKSHILPNVLCSSVVQGQVKAQNLLRKDLNLERDDEGVVTVEGATVSEVDIMGSNGVIHQIYDIIIPSEGTHV